MSDDHEPYEPMDRPLWGPAPSMPPAPTAEPTVRTPIPAPPPPMPLPQPLAPPPIFDPPNYDRSPLPRLPVRQHGRKTNTWVLVCAATVVIVVAAVVVVVLRHSNTAAAAASPPSQIDSPTQQVTTDPAAPTTTDLPTTEQQTTDQTTPVGDTQTLGGPYGMQVSVPAGWQQRTGTSPNVTEMDNPDVPGQYVRFGAAPPTIPGSLLDAVSHYEQTTPNVQPGYQRVQLTSISFGAAPEAVMWEFTYTAAQGTRHAAGLYWRINNIEYVLYASSYEPDWATTEQVFQAAQATVTPS